MNSDEVSDLDEIREGTHVLRRSDPSRLGILTGKKRTLGPRLMVQVDWGVNREYEDVRQLTPRDPAADNDMDALVARGEYGTIEDLRRRITYEKLQGTLTDIFYSMATSDMDFYAYQFKPVLRFIDSPTNRLLIADEVGLGKTIEAGLIWTEWQARHDARRLLVVCPPALCPKWQRELEERFQLPAQVVNADGLIRLLDQYRRRSSTCAFVAIVSYAAISPRKRGDMGESGPINEKELLDGIINPPQTGRLRVPDREVFGKNAGLLYDLLQDEECTGFLDMVVFDEAHRMKNTGTIYFTLGDALSRVSGAALCLSATPIHNQSRDLFALLRLVDPEYFREEFTFRELVDRNRPVVRLQNAISAPRPDRQELAALTNEIASSSYFKDSRVAASLQKAVTAFDGSAKHAAEISLDAEKLNLLGSYLNRTRKIQVPEHRVQRQTQAFAATMRDTESKFYKVVLNRVRAAVRARGEKVTAFHLIAPALRMTSCMPTMVECLKQGKYGGWDDNDDLREMATDFDLFSEDIDEVDLGIDLAAFRDYDFEMNDSKYAVLREALLEDIDDQKILIFAFFKDTIAYLARRLNKDGISARTITGDIRNRIERDRLMQAFRDDNFRVLLLSEIGSEGVDLQFCRTMFNYDLPWNPMRVEQRIGRIHRIGQQAKSITIVKFYIPDTIDGRIYTHLYEKIGIFRNTIGDLENIVGEYVSKLTAELLCENLTPEQEERVIANVARAIEERRDTERNLERSSESLIAFTDYLADKIGDSKRMGRYLRPEELRLFVEDFLAREEGDSQMQWDSPFPGCGRIRLAVEVGERFRQYCQTNALGASQGFAAAGRFSSITFDPEIHKDVRHRKYDVALVNHLHPLIRWITSEMNGKVNAKYDVAAVKCQSNVLDAGIYFHLVMRLSLDGLRKRERLLYAVRNIATGETTTDHRAETLLNDCLKTGRSLFPDRSESHAGTLDELKDLLWDVCAEIDADYKDEMHSRAQVAAEQTATHFNRKIQIAQARLETMKDAHEERQQGIALAERQIEALASRRDQQHARIKSGREPTAKLNHVCCGLIEVVNE
jgi:SNF2 family DNA or RNA helicase